MGVKGVPGVKGVLGGGVKEKGPKETSSGKLVSYGKPASVGPGKLNGWFAGEK